MGLRPLATSERLPLIDALRAFALFGIFQVNIQSFVWSGGGPFGFLLAPISWADSLSYLLVATLVSIKFMALFAFLFGYGFALQMKSMRRAFSAQGPADFALLRSQHIYRKRLWFLLAIGLAHGCLLYYGDVLSMYAFCGFILVLYTHVRPAALVKSTRRWWMAFAAITTLLLLGGALLSHASADKTAASAAEMQAETLALYTTYSTASFVVQIPVRSKEFLIGLAAGSIQFIPMVVGLFLLGAVAARLGWLRHAARHRRVAHRHRRVGVGPCWRGLELLCAVGGSIWV
jgi:uncharacterized protein